MQQDVNFWRLTKQIQSSELNSTTSEQLHEKISHKNSLAIKNKLLETLHAARGIQPSDLAGYHMALGASAT